MLIFIRDLGSSLMFFGGFLALLYVATGRLSLVGVGGDDVPRRRRVLRQQRAHVHDRVETWLDPFHAASSYEQVTSERQATRSPNRCSPRPTAGCSGEGFGRAAQPAGRARRSCRRRTPT